MMESLAFTWSPDPKKFTGVNPVFQFNETLPFIRLLMSCSDDFSAYPELNLNGNIHWHAEVRLSDKVKWFKKVLPKFKYNGFVYIKKVFDKEKWDIYIQKDMPIMEMVLGFKLPINYKKEGKGQYKSVVKHYLLNTPKEKILDDDVRDLVDSMIKKASG